ncbi:ead/Ea22-like family protein [Serratia marcescens]|uniref:ead/Ea22-like family protein n=1 Tax=Serratia marcescens TaxID=615 RepID=UPI001F09FD00|nr:ead/Ea22-like family protein [Serratia marcescens]
MKTTRNELKLRAEKCPIKRFKAFIGKANTQATLCADTGIEIIGWSGFDASDLNAKSHRVELARFIAAADPETILAILAELEAKDNRIAELERANTSQDDHINQQQDRIESLEKTNTELGQRLGAAEKRIIELDYLRLSACEVFKEIGNELGCNPDNESIMMAIDALKERLATPVRLPPPTAWMRGDDKTTFGPIFTKNKEYAESQWGDSAIALYSVPVGIKEAGFSDERNLMHINERGRETSLIWNKNNSENGDVQLFRLVGFTVQGDE